MAVATVDEAVRLLDEARVLLRNGQINEARRRLREADELVEEQETTT